MRDTWHTFPLVVSLINDSHKTRQTRQCSSDEAALHGASIISFTSWKPLRNCKYPMSLTTRTRGSALWNSPVR
jgi:hypothetical protein